MAYGLKGAATLLLRSFDAPGGADEPRAAQAFERTHLSHAHHVLTLRSALVDRVAQNRICGPMIGDNVVLRPPRLSEKDSTPITFAVRVARLMRWDWVSKE